MIIYSREKKELIIPTGFASDSCAEAVEEARQTGFAEGEEAQKAKLTSVKLTENGTYTREDGWKLVEVDVDGTTCDLEAEKGIVIDPTTFSGEEVYYPSDNKDGMASVRVTGMSAQQYRTNMQNTWIEGTGGVAAGVREGAQGLVITQNGTYTATGTSSYSNPYLGVSQVYPILYNEVTVNIPQLTNIQAILRATLYVDTDVVLTNQTNITVYFEHIDGYIQFSEGEFITIDDADFYTMKQNGETLTRGNHTIISYVYETFYQLDTTHYVHPFFQQSGSWGGITLQFNNQKVYFKKAEH